MGDDLKLAASLGYLLLPVTSGGVSVEGAVIRYEIGMSRDERIPLVLRLLTGEARKKRIARVE